jgi:hypothetical protein
MILFRFRHFQKSILTPDDLQIDLLLRVIVMYIPWCILLKTYVLLMSSTPQYSRLNIYAIGPFLVYFMSVLGPLMFIY